MIFRDRSEAGRRLAEVLARRYPERSGMVVLALPRGGVPVAHEVAKALRVPMDIFLVRKLGLPGHEELAMGAIASGGARVLNQELVVALGIAPDIIEAVAADETRELQRREREYRGSTAPLPLRDRTVVLVDDGLATGSTMRAAVMAVRARDPAEVVVAVPVGAAASCEELRTLADDVVCAATPEPFSSVGRWYRDFAQTTDAEVEAVLAQRGKGPTRASDGRH